MSKILWIEDDYYHVKGLIRPLEKEGFTIDVASSATDAYRKIQAWQLYDLIIVDLILPMRDQKTNELIPEVERWREERYVGLGLLKYMHNCLKPSTPVLVLSIVSSEESQQLMALGIDDLLLKRGLLPGQVQEAVHEALGRKNA